MARTDRTTPSTGLLAEALAEESGHVGPECHVVKAMAAHPDLADDIAAVLRDRRISHAAAARVFRRHEINLSDNTISRHRANECTTCRRAGTVW